MCGILGQLSYDGPVDSEALTAGLAELETRGPDGQGLWIAADARVALGHTRLAIRDRLNGRQPLVSPDGQLRCVVNGEFYRAEALRRELRTGYAFQTRSDSELALALYAARGLDFVHDLHGEFALLLWDERAQRLIAVRDRFGIKPLCYARTSAGLMLSSKARALLAMGHPRRWNAAGLHQALALQYLLPEQTLIAGLAQLPPGHVLIAGRDGSLHLQPYWQPDYPLAGQGRLRFDTAREALAAGLEQAVQERLVADVPVCGHLSGGIDSSAVLALMASHGRHQAFSVTFPETPDYDEFALAKASAAYCGAELNRVEVRCQDLIAHFPDAVRLGEGLSINGHTVAKYLLNRAIRAAGYRVALTGEGADELLLGYAHFRQDLGLAANNPLVAGFHTAEADVAELGVWRFGPIPSWLLAKALQGRRVARLLTGGLRLDEAFTALDAVLPADQLAGRHRLHQSAWLWIRLALANYILPTVGDGAEMAHGIEGRLPFLDHRLFEALRDLPPEAHFSGGLEKALLRQALGERLTPGLRQRPKHPFLAPPLTAFAAWRDFLRSSFAELAPLPQLDFAAIHALLSRLEDAPADMHRAWDPVLNLLLSATWLQHSLRLESP